MPGEEAYNIDNTMARILNKKILIENGKSKLDKQARRHVLQALEAALEKVDVKKIIMSKVLFQDNKLKINHHEFDLKRFQAIYVVGGGKASGNLAEALESILRNRITDGLVNVPYDSGPYKTQKIRFQEANHPIPDNAGVKGAREIIDLVSKAGKNDLIICLISGGGSSLMPLPHSEITLDDKQRVTDDLLKSGATISEINTVRKHISEIKGGWLAKKAYPATVINLILSDVIGDRLEFIASGPTVPDSTKFSDAEEILKRYRIWEKIPQSVKTVLVKGRKGLITETPKKEDKVFRRVYNLIIGNNRLATLAACKKLSNTGVPVLLLTTFLEGEAKHVGTMLASILEEIDVSGNPMHKPCGIVAGGETTVNVVGDGKGGRNQEIALSAALKISGMEGVAIASFSTDGIDGPTDAAGAIVDGNTIARSLEKGLNVEKFLSNNDSYSLFSKLNDLILTGQTGTNVNDVSIAVAVM
ncbi:MAG: glycerate kinase [Candidatus Bathyarchaeota archaeon]|nr:MAG: glycerate kinase [Candidatus Bathyarchaeota archaeon]